MTRIPTYFAFLLLIVHTGCIPSAPQQIAAFRSPELRTDATFKVVSLNTNDQVLALIEQELLSRGFKVIADNYLRTQTAPAGNVTVTTRDTSYNTMQYRDAGVEIFREKPSDYVVRYSMAWRYPTRFFEYFSASVINTASGAVEFTYNFKQATNSSYPPQDVNAIIRDFASKMQVKQ